MATFHMLGFIILDNILNLECESRLCGTHFSPCVPLVNAAEGQYRPIAHIYAAEPLSLTLLLCRCRVFAPDLRGHGRSTVQPDHDFSYQVAPFIQRSQAA